MNRKDDSRRSAIRLVPWAAIGLLVLTSASAGVCLAAGPQYTVTDLGTLGGNLSGARSISNNGQVVGWAETSSGNGDAFIWTASGGMQDLGAPPGNTGSDAFCINSNGHVVGYYLDSQSTSHAFLWTASGGMSGLPLIDAYGINDSAQVAGVTSTGAFLWTASGGLQALGGNGSYAQGINNSGQVVGYVRSADEGRYHAFLWSSIAGIQDLGTLPGSGTSFAIAINNNGQVVGSSADHTFLWSANAGMQDLGTLPGGSSGPSGINDSNQVVGTTGWFDNGTITNRAFLWTDIGGMQDLNDLIDPNSGWVLERAMGINNLGQIVGQGANPAGQTHAFLLTPVPEPAMLSLLALGGLWVARRCRRRRRSAA